MVKKLFVFSLFITSVFSLYAQRELSNPLIDSKEIITKGAALHNQGKYKEAIAEYMKVPEGDTAYSDVLYEMILSNYKDSSYAVAEKLVQKGFSMFPERSSDWYGLLADIYDDTKREQEALKVYDTVLAQKPYNYITWFNRGISHFRLSKLDEAATDFQRCIIINPYYSSAHYFLGRISLLKGNLTQAMMSFACNLLVTPGNNYYKYSVGYLNSISEVNNTVAELLPKYKPGKEDDFDMLQEIITSKVALDRKYKLQANLEDQVVRQLQVIMEKIEYNANDKGFWMQYYVPMYKSLWEHGHFEAFINYIFSELDLKTVKEYNRKEKKAIQAMTDEAVNYLGMIRETQVLKYTEREKAGTRYYIQNYAVSGTGSYGKNSKGQDVVTGPWLFYYPGGNLKSKGNFDTEGRRIGEWIFYYENGLLKERTNYVADKANGKSESWYNNGVQFNLANYKDDELDGDITYWFYNGILKSVIKYKDGKKEGIAKYYNSNDYLKTIAPYSNDLEEGEETTYYPDGKLESKLSYTKDVVNGAYNDYHENGKIKTSGSYAEGKKTGTWKSYFDNGNQQWVENYTKGELDGEYTLWHRNGKIQTKSIYVKGEVDGKKEDFDDDGIVFSESIFERGRLRDIKFFDKKGQIISTTSSRKGNADITFYGPDGSKSSDGYYTKEGLLEGKGSYYYKSGQPSTVAFYKKGLLDGKRNLFYENGKLKQEGNFTANEADGYFTDYYLNGEVSEEGWYVKGKRQGTVIVRDMFGKTSSHYYYLDNEVHGVADYFHPSGNLDYKAFYDNGWYYRMEQYDTTGKLISESKLVKGEGKIIFNHFNGRQYIESNYKNYRLNGIQKITNGDGSKSSLGYYKNGNRDSVYTAWYPNGKVRQEGKYVNGEKVGTWKSYYFNGVLSNTEVYEDGKQNGKEMQYNEDGTVDKEIDYKNDELDGAFNVYADNKQLAIVFYYKEGVLKGYSYEGKDGKVLPMIPIEKGAGKVLAYFKNGNKSCELEFKDYLVDGARNLYYSNGKEYIVSQRVNGYDNGPKKIYYPGGKLQKEENYVYGKLQGRSRLYSENGALQSDLNYHLDELHGECKYYTAGKADTYIYYYGVLESKK